jgi:hypothetical protein
MKNVFMTGTLVPNDMYSYKKKKKALQISEIKIQSK